MKKILITLIIIIFSHNLFSQKDSVALAEDLIYNLDFKSAIYFYKKIIELDPKNPDHHFKLGFCYLNTVEKRDSAIIPIKVAIDLYEDLSKQKQKKVITSPIEMDFYLARAFRVNYMFDSAILVLNVLEAEVKNKKVLQLIGQEKRYCIESKELVENPVNIEIVNMGSVINTIFTEHTPVFTGDESELIFTSRKQLFSDSPLDYDNEYDENIYISTKDSLGVWSEPQSITSINTTAHEATISLSFDGTKLFIYKDEDNGSIYYSEFNNGFWQAAIKLNENINTKSRETHCSMSYDETTLYFTSDRQGGYGGLDIYVSKKLPDGNWSKAINMGPGINTPKDEESPYILPDDKTLYFSSKGHGGMGGFDVFKCTLTEFGTWSLPKNIGFPINSIDDDVYFFPTADEQGAYFASKKGKGFGSSDIYLMKLPDAEGSNIVVMTGKLVVCEGALPHADIMITDNTTNDYYVATPKNGKFIFVTQKEHSYTIVIEVDNKVVFEETIVIAKDAPRIQLYKAIRLDPQVPCNKIFVATDEDLIDARRIGPNGDIFDNFVEIDNILFPLNAVGKIMPNKTLDTLCLYLKRNPDAKIEVGGYADASGKAEYNYNLALRRAQAVKDYLVENGVLPNQIEVVSYGEENPIAINKNPDKTWNKDGQALNRRVEFRLLEQGEETLLIWGMKVQDKIKNTKYKFNYKKNVSNDIETEE